MSHDTSLLTRNYEWARGRKNFICNALDLDGLAPWRKGGIRFLLALLLLGGVQPLRAQSVHVQWDSLYPMDYSEMLHDIVRLKDGRLAAVGETTVPGKGKQGLFMLFGALDGELLQRRTFGGFRDDILLSMTEAKDGNFYLVGTTDAGGKDGWTGWLIRLDEDGEELTNLSYKEYNVSRFEKIVWTKTGKGLIAGRSDHYEGSILIFPVKGKQIEKPVAVGEGMVQNLVAMIPDADRGVWLCGNARKSDISRSGDVWAIQLDDRGSRLDCCAPIKGRAPKELHGAAASPEGGLLLAGEIWTSAAGDNDAWLTQISPTGMVDTQSVFGVRGVMEYASVPLTTPGGHKWLIIHRTSGASVQVYDDELGEKEVYPLLRDNFRPTRIFQLRPNLYLLAGTTYDPLRKGDAVRLLCLQDDETIVKGDPAVQCSDIGFFETDGDGDGRLGPDEHGYVSFSLKNTGRGPILSGAVSISVEKPLGGFVLKHNRQEFNYIGESRTESISIGVKGDKTITNGTAVLRINIEVPNMAPVSFTAEVPCGKNESRKTTLSFNKPNPNRSSGAKSNEYESADPNFPVELRVISPNATLKTLDAKTFRNGARVQDLPKNRQELSAAAPELEYFVYTFTATVPLEDGRNVIYFEMDDGHSDSIVVLYSKEKKPNLHLLAIGVPDDNLHFTAKDARDFARTMCTQAGLGLFDRIYADTLFTKENTDRYSIEKAFNGLVNRYQAQQKIKPNDYLLIFISSHGLRRDDGRFCLLPTGYDPNSKIATTVDYRDLIEKYLNLIRCKKIIFLDACQSGSAKSAPDPGLSDAVLLANSVAEATVTFTSCSSNESSYELSGEENGAFTEALLEAFSGQPVAMPDGQLLPVDTKGYDKFGAPRDVADNMISLEELNAFLAERVPYLVKSKQGFSQHPSVNGVESVEYLPIFKLK